MFEVAVVEDEDVAAQRLTAALRRYQAERGVPLHVRRHVDGTGLVAGYRPGTDLLLLDIEMPGLDGVAAAELVRRRDPDVAIVFVTNAAAQAVRGYAVGALGFLLKPVSYDALARELDRAVERARSRADATVDLVTEDGPLRLSTADVVCLEASRRRVVVDTLDGRYAVAGPLKQRERDLAPHGFFRCHHGYLVNLRHVVAVRQATCRLVTGREVPVSRPHRAAFLAALTDRLAARGA
ncbi:LytR/AlgR family response regulator transcription factor [Cellulomonas sp. Y8]|uniref:LytR/AlgR family response regulator transcription factor n=1 Tax=Cellulomonas sp. Y8 TaxID=2591145 RepID=UPI003D70548D